MATNDKAARRKLSILELASELNNVSKACRIMGYSRQRFFEIRSNFQTYGAGAVIARSFARIHETNLKKQGLLALTFSDQADYEKVRENDRLSLVGLAGLAEGKPVTSHLLHSDGTSEDLSLRHSYSEAQLDWFRAGSAINLLRMAA